MIVVTPLVVHVSLVLEILILDSVYLLHQVHHLAVPLLAHLPLAAVLLQVVLIIANAQVVRFV